METISKRNDRYNRLLVILTVVMGLITIGMPQRTAAENIEKVQERVQEQEAEAIISQATLAWHNFMHDPDLSGFRAHLKKVHGVLIFPRLMKGAFVVGMEGGNGVLLAHDEKTGSWSEPAFYEISSASFGLQAGVETSEAILVIETRKGIESLLSRTIKLGGPPASCSLPARGRASAWTRRAATSRRKRRRSPDSQPTATPTPRSERSSS